MKRETQLVWEKKECNTKLWNEEILNFYSWIARRIFLA